MSSPVTSSGRSGRNASWSILSVSPRSWARSCCRVVSLPADLSKVSRTCVQDVIARLRRPEWAQRRESWEDSYSRGMSASSQRRHNSSHIAGIRCCGTTNKRAVSTCSESCISSQSLASGSSEPSFGSLDTSRRACPAPPRLWTGSRRPIPGEPDGTGKPCAGVGGAQRRAG